MNDILLWRQFFYPVSGISSYMSSSPIVKRLSLAWKETIWVLSTFTVGISIGILAIYFFETPNIESIHNFPFRLTSTLYDRTGEHELYRLYDEEDRVVVPHEAIPDSVRSATIASEDAYFYIHRGINPIAILRAAKVNILNQKIEQGASTITQQLARNLFLTREPTLKRKIREAFLAIKIEQNIGKDEILDLYLNTIPYGANTYGIEAAAQRYFHKEATDLSVDESALLAALPNAPSYFSPYQKNDGALRSRQEGILKRMHDLKFITNQELDTALSTDTLSKVAPRKDSITAPHFVFYVIDELKKKYSEEELRTGGLEIITTLDLDLQKVAEGVVSAGAKKNISRGADNAALVALDPKTGEILSMVGSKDYFDNTTDGNVNVTIQSRQPGSTFKPFAYATAFEKGFQPETLILDTLTNFGPDGSGKNYIPHNYDGKFHGQMTMRQALARSLNVPAVQTLALAGVTDTIGLATRLGITTLTDPKRYGLALVLGGAEVRPLDMANAFSVFSQEGIHTDTTPFIKVTDRTGKEYVWNSDTSRKQVLEPEIARKINSILSDNVARTPTFGPNSPLAFPKGTVVAVKTGTTQNFRDAWTVGYTPSIAVAVWAGNNDNRPMKYGADGVFVAAPIFRSFIDQALKRFPETGFTAYTPTGTTGKDIAFGGEVLSDEALGMGMGGDNSRIIYIDKKTGREISETKAKKLSKSRVEKRVVFDEEPIGEIGDGGIVTWNTLRDSYGYTP